MIFTILGRSFDMIRNLLSSARKSTLVSYLLVPLFLTIALTWVNFRETGGRVVSDAGSAEINGIYTYAGMGKVWVRQVLKAGPSYVPDIFEFSSLLHTRMGFDIAQTLRQQTLYGQEIWLLANKSEGTFVSFKGACDAFVLVLACELVCSLLPVAYLRLRRTRIRTPSHFDITNPVNRFLYSQYCM